MGNIAFLCIKVVLVLVVYVLHNHCHWGQLFLLCMQCYRNLFYHRQMQNLKLFLHCSSL